jgi:hypothetical protein
MAVATLVLIGCGSSNSAANPSSPTPTPQASPSASTQTPSPRTLSFKLVACTGPTVCGDADPLKEGPSKFGKGTVRIDVKDGEFSVTVTATGFTPKSKHLINIHSGTCAAPNLMDYQQLEIATADAKGKLSSVTTRGVAYFVPGAGMILTVHGDDTIRRQTHIACANLTN